MIETLLAIIMFGLPVFYVVYRHLTDDNPRANASKFYYTPRSTYWIFEAFIMLGILVNIYAWIDEHLLK